MLEAAGASLADVVKLTNYFTSADHFPAYRDVKQRLLPKDPPASTSVVVAALLHPDFMMEGRGRGRRRRGGGDAMSADLKSLYTDAARFGLPIFFPLPKSEVFYNFDMGLAAEETFPLEDFKRLSKEVVARDGGGAFQYGDTSGGYADMVYGYTALRERIAGRIAQRDGVDAVADGVLLTSGSVQAIALAINGFLDPGDAVIIEAPSFPYAIRYMQTLGAQVHAVPVDGDGMDVDAVEEKIDELTAAGVRVKAVYTISTFQLPTGTCMSLERRKKLVGMAHERGFMIIEDHVYGDLRFEGERLPTLLSLSGGDLVVQADSFSKTIAPGLRLGWLVGKPEAIDAALAVRQDLGVSHWISRMMDLFLAEGKLDPHIEMVNRVYRAKRDAAAAALSKHCPHVSLPFGIPKGAFYLWCELEQGITSARVHELAQEEGVFARPGEAFFGWSTERQFFRISYSHVQEDEIERGMAPSDAPSPRPPRRSTDAYRRHHALFQGRAQRPAHARRQAHEARRPAHRLQLRQRPRRRGDLPHRRLRPHRRGDHRT